MNNVELILWYSGFQAGVVFGFLISLMVWAMIATVMSKK